ncbi:heavy metal translocating P-type ATPase [Synechococcus sp. PCC 6312]|uniref:heavy metal translocating P-type ATPase n=1 Tax=Synechococcus sp. (strain ATCC 27167 / PCC 6312) TaxID=195253 RepID=UPI00029ED54E|nr:heavy metal translocating P-type ATPase [Synechococcus sp. PCC 6312]AFY61874.1 heavy metal-translocating P-type ATPase, Cd/Co/Hg/Pb/Zn-transporting [Synechococcus sp. PCC 6312]
MTQTPSLKTQQMQVDGMDCIGCKMKIEGSLERLGGVTEAAVTVATGRLVVTYDPEQVNEAAIQDRIKSLGYTLKTTARLQHNPGADHSHAEGHSHEEPDTDDGHEHGHNHRSGEFKLKQELPPVLIAIALFAIAIIFKQPLHNTPYNSAEFAVIIPAYLLSGWNVLKTAGRNILRGQVFDENFLMTIATLGALAIHQLPEAVAVMLFFRVGELFQEYSVGRSRRSIRALLEVRPDTANLKLNGIVRQVSPERVKVGDLVLVKPGEKIPLDGEILEGRSQVDTSALTGESVPRTVKPGDSILGGMINQSGMLTIRVTKLFGESSIAKILDLVENASNKKASTEKFITKFARYYTPIVVFLSLVVALLPPLFIPGADRSDWVYRALVLLVISCPCGLVISIPLGYFGGIGGAATRGILVKGSIFLDSLTEVKTVVFDKTGTLTKGTFNVTRIVTKNGFSEAELLRLAANAESHSNHPVGLSIRETYAQPIADSKVTNYEEIAGHGIRAIVENHVVIAGNDRLLHRENIKHDTCNVAGTVVHLAVDGCYAGYILIADEVKADAAQAIRDLRRMGVEKIVMLTGDNQVVAQSVAHQLGLDAFVAELLPEGKVYEIEKLLDQAGKKKLAFVGDGINDAPVIARADIGIAMGGLGSDAAIETADVVLMTDDPSKVAEAIKVAQKTRQIVVQNIVIALMIKAIFIGLGSIGLATLWEAVFADVGVAVFAIFNASRVLK